MFQDTTLQQSEELAARRLHGSRDAKAASLALCKKLIGSFVRPAQVGALQAPADANNAKAPSGFSSALISDRA